MSRVPHRDEPSFSVIMVTFLYNTAEQVFSPSTKITEVWSVLLNPGLTHLRGINTGRTCFEYNIPKLVNLVHKMTINLANIKLN
jgi:hypothetical protein